VAAVVGDVCGVQAQFPSAARLALRARIRGLRPEDVDRALADDRTLVAAWCMRGTRHLLRSEDLATFLRACHRRGAQWAAWFAAKKWPVDELDGVLEAMSQALDRPHTRPELLDRVTADLGIPKRVQKLSRGWGNVSRTEALEVGDRVISIGNMVSYACFRGIACCGPDRKGEATFVRPDAWIPGYRDVAAPEAELEFTRRYLRAYGPSTPEDMAMWAGLALRDARSMWAAAGDGLSEVSLDGQRMWILREDLRALRTAKLDRPVVRLLPYFDTYLLGHRGRDHLVDAAHYKRVYRPAAWIAPVVLVDGRVAGIWSHKRKGDLCRVTVVAFRRLDRADREGIEVEAEDVARFLGGRGELAYGKVAL